MRTIYLIANNLVINNIDYLLAETIDEKRTKRPLSIEGENQAQEISKKLNNVTSIYSSGYSSALSSAKYLAKDLDLIINIDNSLNDRKIGQLTKNINLSLYKENQEHDFNYKLPGGESLETTKERMLNVFQKIVKNNLDDNIVIFSHSFALMALLTHWCSSKYNLDNRLILNYKDKVIDTQNDLDVIKITLENEEVIDLENI